MQRPVRLLTIGIRPTDRLHKSAGPLQRLPHPRRHRLHRLHRPDHAGCSEYHINERLISAGLGQPELPPNCQDDLPQPLNLPRQRHRKSR